MAETKAAVATAEAKQVEHIISYVEAGIEALREEMRLNPMIFYIGQGIGPRGGNWTQTKGLWAEFGEERMKDCPIAELGQTGIGVGAALVGAHPVVDIVFLDFLLEAMSQIVQQASLIHYVSNGHFKVPLVIRAAWGDIRSAGPHHSHSFYSYFMHIPGLKVVTPSTPYDVKGLFKTALRDENPVMFLEHKALYNSKGPVPTEEYLLPYGKAAIRREGKDVTVVAVGQMVFRALEAADILAKDGISIEVIDPRTVVPLDRETILNSIAKTGRVAIADEAYSNCGFSAEIAAMAAEEALDELDAPVRRICALPAPHAFSPSLDSYLQPSTERIVHEITELMKD